MTGKLFENYQSRGNTGHRRVDATKLRFTVALRRRYARARFAFRLPRPVYAEFSRGERTGRRVTSSVKFPRCRFANGEPARLAAKCFYGQASCRAWNAFFGGKSPARSRNVARNPVTVVFLARGSVTVSSHTFPRRDAASSRSSIPRKIESKNSRSNTVRGRSRSNLQYAGPKFVVRPRKGWLWVKRTLKVRKRICYIIFLCRSPIPRKSTWKFLPRCSSCGWSNTKRSHRFFFISPLPRTKFHPRTISGRRTSFRCKFPVIRRRANANHRRL